MKYKPVTPKTNTQMKIPITFPRFTPRVCQFNVQCSTLKMVFAACFRGKKIRAVNRPQRSPKSKIQNQNSKMTNPLATKPKTCSNHPMRTGAGFKTELLSKPGKNSQFVPQYQLSRNSFLLIN